MAELKAGKYEQHNKRKQQILPKTILVANYFVVMIIVQELAKINMLQLNVLNIIRKMKT